MKGRYLTLVPVLVAIVGILWPVGAQGQSCLDYGTFMHPMGGLDPQPDYSMNGCFSGDYLYLAYGWGGLKIIDVSDPAYPEVIGSQVLDGNNKAVAISGDIAYVAGSVGMSVVDVSNPASPMFLVNLATPLECVKVEVEGNRLYLLTENGGMVIHDISEPASPQPLGIYPFSSGVDLVIEGTTAYLVSRSFVHVVDVSDATTPLLLGETLLGGFSNGMTKSGSFLYVASQYLGIQVVNVVDPADPKLLANTETGGYPSDVAVIGTKVFVAHPHDGVHVFEALYPATLSFLWSYEMRGSCESLLAWGNRLCVFELGWGFQFLDVTEAPATIEGRQITPDPLLAVAHQGSYCFAAEGDLGMQVFDVSDPANPQSAGLFQTTNPVMEILVENDIAYLAEQLAGIRLVDVSNPSGAHEISLLGTVNPRDMVLREGLLYVADHIGGLVIADVSDPANPWIVWTGNLPDWAYSLDVKGDFAYVIDNMDRLQVIDVSTPDAPFVRGVLDLGYDPMDIQVVGHLAFVPNYVMGLRIIDVSIPESPALINQVFLPNKAVGVNVEGSVAYVSADIGGVVMVDISDPTAARIIGCLPSDYSTEDIALGREHIFIADGSGGLAVAAKQCVAPSPVPDRDSRPVAASLDGIYPNPFNPRTTISFTLVETGPVSLRIYDLSGRLVRVLDESVFEGRRHQVTWDGRDAAGRSVASAPYVVRLQAGGIEQKQKVLLLR